MTKTRLSALALLGATTSLVGLHSQTAQADIIHADDVIIQGSICAGFDCVNGESFGADTIRLKENNLRIHFEDTSNSASFPSNDWRIVINDSTNGGGNYFAVEDTNAARQVFRVDAGAPANSLRVDSAGDVGIGESNPVVELHIQDGDSPTVRLEQDGSSGFTPQTFDLVSNEANFFIRDVTNGSQLPFRIKPGADTNALFIAADNNIGLGTEAPSAPLHVRNTNNLTNTQPHLFIENTNATASNRRMLGLSNNGGAFIHIENRASGAAWAFVNANTGTDFLINDPASAAVEFRLSQAGDLTINGEITTSGSCSGGCDLVFSDDYEIMPIEERGKLMWQNGYLPNVGPTEENGPFNLSQKVGGILNELEHAHIYIQQLNQRIELLEQKANKG